MGIYKRGRLRKYYPGTGVGSAPPAEPGEYRIRDGSGTIVYIGETCSISRRMKEHIRSGKLPAAQGSGYSFEYQLADKRSTSRTRRGHEASKIKEHTPELNKSRGGEGRPASRRTG